MTGVAGLRWAIVDQGRERRETADGLLVGLLRELGVAFPRLTRGCPYCGGPHGPVRALDGPAPAPFSVAVAYADGWAVVAASARGPFAIDAEPRRMDAAALHRIRTTLGDARADAATWTRVEAAVKADGRGLRIDPAEVRLSEVAGGWAARIPGRPDPLFVSEAAGPPGIVVSLAAAPGAASDRSTC
ncbi:chemotaxis protein CheY [Microbacterium oleivorans]|uniref:Chemotaxis protein CheY n=1 Tax=Microbacterium oleivorans TaxID=273677 RepID=A0A7D5IY39_9MICO|nr:chemotaxis protein CheY [Microbacterium oleivorans]QLD10955.1 chemotaxis protein CheY [Microbacterium oleivorans]